MLAWLRFDALMRPQCGQSDSQASGRRAWSTPLDGLKPGLIRVGYVQRLSVFASFLAFLLAGLAPPVARAEFPAGTVAAFNLQTCPAGWAEHTGARGRIVIGTGQGTGLTARSLGETLGEETHTLTQAEMPAHSHSLNHFKYTSWAYTNLWPNSGSAVRYQFTQTSNTGGDQPHNVIMPSIVLLICEKT